MKLNLANLTRDQKIALYDVSQEKKRRLREAAAVYAPNDGQVRVHKSPAWIRAVFAGNGSGKSALAANEVDWALRGYNPTTQKFTRVPARGIIVLDHPEKATDQWIPELQKWTYIKPEQMNKRGKPYVNQITYANGSELLFMFHAQDPLLFESIEADFVVFDEPPPRHIYIALMRGLRRKGRKPWILIVATPISSPWMRIELYDPWAKGERTDIECFTYGTDVNSRNLSDGYIDRMKANLTEKEIRIRLYGEFFDLEGLALAHLFDPAVHIVRAFEWEPDHPCVVIIDPHPSKAHHAVLMGADSDNYLYVIDEYKEKAIARTFAKSLVKRGWFHDYRVVDVVYDSLGNSETTSGEGFKPFGVVLNEVLSDEEVGAHGRATTFKEKDDEDFIERVRDALGIPETPDTEGHYWPKLRFFPHCSGSIHDVQNVQWAQHAKNRSLDENKPKLDIRHRDFLSCIKYGLATNLHGAKGKTKVYRRLRGAESYGVATPEKRRSLRYWRKRLNGR